MKNTKFSKSLVLVITLALVIGAAFGIGTMAEGEEPAVEIVAQNVSYGGSISIMYAVKSTGLADGQYVVIEGTAFNPVDETTEAFTVSDFETTDYDVVVGEENFGKLPVYYTPGIPLKNMATTVTAKAVVYNADNTKAAESASLSYSVLEYLYERQFMFDSVNSADQKKLYSLMLETGDTVQKVLENYGAGFAPSDYAFVSITGGTFDGKTSGIVKKGTEVTLTGNDAGFVVTPVSVGEEYAIVEGSPAVVNNNSTYTVDGSVIINTGKSFEKDGGKFYTNGMYVGVTNDYTSGSAPKMQLWPTTDVATATVANGNLTIETTAVTAEVYAWVAESATPYSSDDSIFFEMEFKLSKMEEGTTWRFFEYVINRGADTIGVEFILQVQDGRFVPVSKTGSSSYSAIEGLPSFAPDVWYNFTMELDTATAALGNAPANYTINGVSYNNVKMINTHDRTSRTWNTKVSIYLPAINDLNVQLDNVIMGRIADEVVTADYERGQGANVNDVNFDCSTAMKTENSNGGIATTTLNADGTATVTSGKDGNYLQWRVSTAYSEGAKHVLEMDIRFDRGNGASSNNSAFRFGNGTKMYYLTVNSYTKALIRLGSSDVYLAKNVWYNLRFEMDYSTETIEVFVNGESCGTVTPTSSTSTYSRAYLYVLNGDSITVDNIYCNYVTEATE
ncbi:MAG: hypothetical protein J6C09_08880 [Clostridia bacterium]|nr:hypothetical protein [Clostridia bacterium]